MKQSYGSTGGNGNCTFPFNYDGYDVTRCLYVDGGWRGKGKQWCSTTSDFEKDKKMGFCATKGLYCLGYKDFEIGD